MRKVSRKLLLLFGLAPDQFYGMLDYIAGVALITLPWFFVNEHNMEVLLFIMSSGILLTVYCIFTDYRFSIIRWLLLRIIIVPDIAAAICLVAAGWPALNSNYIGIIMVVAGITVMAGIGILEITAKKISFLPGQEFALS